MLPSVFIISGPYCNYSQTPINIEYSTPVVYVIFKSDMATSKSGFKLTFTARGNPAVVQTTNSTPSSLLYAQRLTSLPLNMTQPRRSTTTPSTLAIDSRTATNNQSSESNFSLTRGRNLVGMCQRTNFKPLLQIYRCFKYQSQGGLI